MLSCCRAVELEDTQTFAFAPLLHKDACIKHAIPPPFSMPATAVDRDPVMGMLGVPWWVFGLGVVISAMLSFGFKIGGDATRTLISYVGLMLPILLYMLMNGTSGDTIFKTLKGVGIVMCCVIAFQALLAEFVPCMVASARSAFPSTPGPAPAPAPATAT